MSKIQEVRTLNKEELARELKELFEGKEAKYPMEELGEAIDDEFHFISFNPLWNNLAEYLLSKYYLIDRKTKCYEGKLMRGTIYLGDKNLTNLARENDGKYAKIFIEEKK